MSALHTLQAGIDVMDDILSAPIEPWTRGHENARRLSAAVT
jgi:hypothetical protein